MVDIILKREISGRILDLGGGGEGVIGRIYGRAVTAIDIRQEELDEAPGNFERLCMDARRLDFPDTSFDAVTAFYFLMYLAPEDRPAVFAEAARVLRPGGRLHVWDAGYGSASPGPHLVELEIDAAGEPISTTYGVLGGGMELSSGELLRCAENAGLSPVSKARHGEHFYLIWEKT